MSGAALLLQQMRDEFSALSVDPLKYFHSLYLLRIDIRRIAGQIIEGGL
jgi:hypothetical protein